MAQFTALQFDRETHGLTVSRFKPQISRFLSISDGVDIVHAKPNFCVLYHRFDLLVSAMTVSTVTLRALFTWR